MSFDRIRRAQLVVALLAAALGVFVIFNAGFAFSGPGERGLLMGDSYFIGSLFRLNSLGGVALLLAGGSGAIGAQRNRSALVWVGATLALVAGIVVGAGIGDAEVLIGTGNPSNAALLATVALGLGTTAWARNAIPESDRPRGPRGAGPTSAAAKY